MINIADLLLTQRRIQGQKPAKTGPVMASRCGAIRNGAKSGKKKHLRICGRTIKDNIMSNWTGLDTPVGV